MKIIDKKQIILRCVMVAVAIAAASNFDYMIAQKIYDNSLTPSKDRKLTIHAPPPTPAIERKAPEEIKYAAFGSSDTWGSGIKGDRNILSYPKLLSPNAVNLAIRATGPSYPAACTQSMVGENHFDVIILEYFTDGNHGFPTLTRRLRERFPDSIIIILREWSPIYIVNQYGINVQAWAMRHGFNLGNSVHDPLMHKEFMASTDVWTFSPEKKRVLNQEIIASLNNAIILEMERPSDPKKWVDYHHLIHDDYHHKSNAGHEEVANRIRALVDHLGVPKKSMQGQWLSMDSCNSWFDSGLITGIKTSPNWRLGQFSNMNKFALELHRGDGSITLRNPSQKPMNLYIAYMVTSPAPGHYPEVTVSIFNSEEKESEPILLKQQAPDYYGNHYVHVHAIQMIGLVDTGSTVLKFRELQTAKWPFRIVSIALTHEELILEPFQPAGITTWICQSGCTCFRPGVHSVGNLYRCS